MKVVSKTEHINEQLLSRFAEVKSTLFGEKALREQAISAFEKKGIPHRKNEEYRYINMELMLKDEFSFSTASAVSPQHFKAANILTNAIVVAVENGMLNKQLSAIYDLPKGISVLSIQEAVQQPAFKKHFAKYADAHADAFIALNTALAKGGVFIHIDKNTVIDKPVHIISISSAKENLFMSTRNLIVIEETSQAKFIHSFHTAASVTKIVNNTLTEIAVGERAIVHYNQIQDEQESGHLLNTTQVNQQKQSVFTINTFTFSGSVVRNNLNITLDGEHIESHLNGLYLTDGNQVVDNHTLVDHQKPNCNSNELYKGIIEDKATATFNGKIFVRKDAQKTNAFQSNKNILLSDDGTINTKPQLEIYADDVKCSHGTSTGKLDEDKIFYLRSRGLSEAGAKKLLMHAFASEVIEMVNIEELQDYLEQRLSERF